LNPVVVIKDLILLFLEVILKLEEILLQELNLNQDLGKFLELRRLDSTWCIASVKFS